MDGRSRILGGAVLAVSLLVLAGCGDDDSSDGSSSGELMPADEANESEKRDAATEAELGDVVEVGEGMTIQVLAVERSSREPSGDEGVQLEVEIRAENTSDREWYPHETLVACANGDSGAWYADSTYDQMTSMQPGTFLEGQLILGVPADCEDPVLRSAPNGWVTDDAVTVDWNVPAATFG